MPKITRTALKHAAVSLGYGQRAADNIARKIVARPDFDYIVEQMSLPDNVRTWSDPTGEDAVFSVMQQALIHNQAMECAA